jgi:hypothetical protein
MLTEFNGQPVEYIDSLPTIVHKRMRDGAAMKCSVVQADFTLRPCFVASAEGSYAHGATLREALAALHSKLMENMSVEERIDDFIKAFPKLTAKASNATLSEWHHRLTGSCQFGRDSFMESKGLKPSGRSTISKFIETTQDAYGSEVIKQLKEKYNEEGKQVFSHPLR